MNMFKKLWFAIVSSDNKPLIDKIDALTISSAKKTKEIARANEVIEHRNKEIVALHNLVDDLNTKIVRLEKELVEDGKHSSISAYNKWLTTNVRPANIMYDFGKGRKRVHTIFKESIKDEGIIRTFVTDDLGFDGSKYANADNLVYSFNHRLSSKFPTRQYYDSDKHLYGKIEYWAAAKETISKLRTNNKSFDCDDSMTLRYSCLYYLLKDYFPNDMWRLRGFIVDIWTGGGHALLGWVKEGPNDWVPIETTFYDTKSGFIWKNNYTIESQMLYQIRYSFDHITEYKKQ